MLIITNNKTPRKHIVMYGWVVYQIQNDQLLMGNYKSIYYKRERDPNNFKYGFIARKKCLLKV